MGIIRMIVVGFVVGGLARWFFPGPVPMHWYWSILLGIAGSFLAGFVIQMLSPAQRQKPFHPAGWMASIIGAMVLILINNHFHFLT